ncbi:MAG: class I SAM-dependent methyltransferase, partial [Lachnospiraceae bacterium]|nr:class I SAM-dependent methyltransferase [Lachnospiraceae bacterium]
MNDNSYSTIKPQSFGEKAVLAARTKIYRLLEKELPLNELEAIIDVGVTADREQEFSNFFEKLYPYPERITAFSNQDASWLSEQGIRFAQGDALNMPFADNTFDLAFSSAVIEHMGSRENQHRFIRECVRVSKKYVFITTPNRYYPIELHTMLPLLHWLPPRMYRNILRRLNKPFFAQEENLNL